MQPQTTVTIRTEFELKVMNRLCSNVIISNIYTHKLKENQNRSDLWTNVECEIANSYKEKTKSMPNPRSRLSFFMRIFGIVVSILHEGPWFTLGIEKRFYFHLNQRTVIGNELNGKESKRVCCVLFILDRGKNIDKWLQNTNACWKLGVRTLHIWALNIEVATHSVEHQKVGNSGIV